MRKVKLRNVLHCVLAYATRLGVVIIVSNHDLVVTGVLVTLEFHLVDCNRGGRRHCRVSRCVAGQTLLS